MPRTTRTLTTMLLAAIALWTASPAQGQTAGPFGEVGTTGWRQVSAGNDHTCAVGGGGSLFCWGADDRGQLGDGGIAADRDVPVLVAGGGRWRQVSAGAGHTCGVRTSGRLYCWGFDGMGQLGDGGPNADQSVPVEVAGGRTDWAQVATGTTHTCATRTTGRLYCWGSDFAGELGNGAATGERTTPVQVAGGRTDWDQVSLGGMFTCANQRTGRLFCWGNDLVGQLGDGGSAAARVRPTPVSGGATTWTRVSAGDAHACGLRTNGRLYCWGGDGAGQLGDGVALADRPTPSRVGGPSSTTIWADVTAGAAHTCGRQRDGRLACWGHNADGQRGDGGSMVAPGLPSAVLGSATDWRQVDAGAVHTCARTATGRLYCWGLGDDGRLGHDDTASATGPVEVWFEYA